MQSYPVVDGEGRKGEKRRIVKKGTKEHEKTGRKMGRAEEAIRKGRKLGREQRRMEGGRNGRNGGWVLRRRAAASCAWQQEPTQS